jgi:uncharacterized protein YycO
MVFLKVGEMTKILVAFLLVFPFGLYAFELKVGDILLQPLSCWSCNLIEEQEKSPYSHMGMVIEVGQKVKVVEALGTVKMLSLSTFNERTEKGQNILVLRLKNTDVVDFLQEHQEALSNYFKASFEGLPYDHDFLWNNFDEKGREKLYCSEFISKLYLHFLGIKIPLKKMKFNVNRDEWITYFNGNPPDDYPGNSPAIFHESSYFVEIGIL